METVMVSTEFTCRALPDMAPLFPDRKMRQNKPVKSKALSIKFVSKCVGWALRNSKEMQANIPLRSLYMEGSA